MEILRLNELLRLIFTNLKLLTSIGIASIILSAILSLMLPEWYKSTTVIYPVKLSQAPVNETALRHGNIVDFGETQEAEQAIEILNSTRLRERVINKFDLYTHYKIPKSKKFSRTFTLKRLDGNLDIKRTKFNSISITVIDKNPVIASEIANDIAANLDSIKFEIIQDRAKDLLANLENQKKIQLLIIDTLKLKIEDFSKRGVMSQFQRGYLIQAYAQASSNEKERLRTLVEENIRYGEDFDRTEKEYNQELENSFLLEKYVVQTRADADVRFSQKFVVDPAIPAERKYFPVRWLLVAIGLISSLFLAIGILLFKEKWPSYKKSIIG